MFIYFTILDELQEILQMLRSMSTCCIVFNKKAEVIHINKAAAKFLKVENMEDSAHRKLKLVLDTQFNSIILDSLNGITLSDVEFQLRRVDDSLVNVNLKVSLYHKLKDVFIFQFSELKPVASTANQPAFFVNFHNDL